MSKKGKDIRIPSAQYNVALLVEQMVKVDMQGLPSMRKPVLNNMPPKDLWEVIALTVYDSYDGVRSGRLGPR